MNSILRSPKFLVFRRGILILVTAFFVALVPSLGNTVMGTTGEPGRENLSSSATATPTAVATKPAPLQSGGTFEIKPSVIAGGGGTSSNGTTRIDGTIGQAVLGTSTGGTFSLLGGFWQAQQQPQFSATVSGTITNCANATPPGISNVSVSIVGPAHSHTPVTNASGFYTQDVDESGLTTITPSKTALTPGSAGINVGDVLRAQQIFLTSITPTACQTKAADINEDAVVNVIDVNGIRRFFLNFNTGIFNTGQWRFIPTSNSVNVTANTTQNFTAVVLGDVTGDIASGPIQQEKRAEQKITSVSPTVPTVESSVTLPTASVATNVVTTFTLPITVDSTTGKNYIGFQADFTFNENIINITAASAAGLTASGWSVSGNLQPDTTPPTRTFRFIGNVNDGSTALVGAGVLLNLTVTRVSSTAGQSSPLTWAAGANGFKFLESVGFTLVSPAASTNGSVTIGAAPTSVEFNEFNAIGYDNGVHLNWHTGFEAANLGFNIYREVAGQRTLVNQDVIAGSALRSGLSTKLQAGQSYGWWDSAGDQRKAQYWIEEIDLGGLRTLHGPFGVRFVGGKPARESQAELLSQLGKTAPSVRQLPLNNNETRTGAVHTDVSIMGAGAQDPSGLSGLKMTVREEGWYRITKQDLKTAGFEFGRNLRNLQLYLNGVEQAIRVVGEDSGRLDSIEFFATGQDTPMTDAHVYWLVSGDSAGKRIGTVKNEGKSAGASSFPFTVERRDRSVYFSSLRNGEASNFFGQVITSRPVDQAITVQHLDTRATGQSELEVALQGVTEQASGHSVRVLLNGLQIGKMVFSGQSNKSQKFPIGSDLLREGDNVVTLVSEIADSDVSLVDYLRITYPHTYSSDHDSLRMSVSSESQTIDGFSDSSVRVFDITDPSNPVEIAGKVVSQDGGYAVSLEAGQGTRTLLALTNNKIKSPSAIQLDEPSNLRNAKKHKTDMLIITRREFFGALEPLKNLRESQGLRVEMVDLTDIYDEFSNGEENPQAIRDFLLFASTSWKKKPSMVLFAGHASLDPRNYLGFGNSDIVPTKLIDTSLMETASDDWFVDFNNDGLPELAVGRLPFRTQSEASTMVSKILSYESSAPANEALLVPDVNDEFDFNGASMSVRDLLPSKLKINLVDRALLDPSSAKQSVIDAINRGQKIVNYIGHGSVNQWKGNVLTNDDARALVNGNHLPVFIMMTCLNGYFFDASLDSISESLLKAERGGAAAVWASSGMTLPGDQAPMNLELYRRLFNSSGQSITLGEATLRAKAATSDPDVRRTWVLLGDPAMKLK
jgi:hypothetical protein